MLDNAGDLMNRPVIMRAIWALALCFEAYFCWQTWTVNEHTGMMFLSVVLSHFGLFIWTFVTF